MKRLLLIAAAALSTLLAGCTIIYGGDRCAACGAGSTGTGEPTKPKVLIVDGQIQVDQETLFFGNDPLNVPITIVWSLPEGYTFPANGIVFEPKAAEEFVNCQPIDKGARFSCVNKHTKRGIFKYGINVNRGDTPLKPVDPFAWN